MNEIMFDPDGNENTDEFIELYNDGDFTVYLRGWWISDGEGRDSIIAVEQDLDVLPGQYVLILDQDYFADGSTTYDGLIPETALVVTISNSTLGAHNLPNGTAKRISLISPQGATVSAFTYSLGNYDGYSDEKILPEAGDSTSNWTNSICHHGTPGKRNSVTPPDYDLAVSQLFTEPQYPQVNDSFSIASEVRNTGQLAYSDTLRLFEIFETPAETLLIHTWTTALLAPDSSAMFAQRLLMASGSLRRFCSCLSGHDERSDNDSRCLIASPTAESGTLLMNEIMYAPEPQRSEWIELINATGFTLSLDGWSLGDGTGIAVSSRRFRFPQILLHPNEYVVIAADSSIFYENVPPPVPILVWDNAPITLNDAGDSLILYDPNGDPADRVDYRPSWGDGDNGMSLERISVRASSNNPLNWASSLDSTGATPGRLNSRTLPESGTQENLLSLEPNPFSPDGDGRDDLLVVRYRLEQANSRLDLKIYDVRGREVRRLANNTPAAYTGDILWDGKDDSGRDLPTGLYIVYLEALGKGGSRMQSAKRAVALARRS